ncbi:MAG: membrane protein insertase YidC [Planctomycetaceae bacterium]|nr:membrane protein insertase YidC [Planctomycetaceae bacterium]
MSRFIQPPQQRYQRPQASRTANPQSGGCSQFLFLLALLMLFNLLILKACAPEEGADSGNTNLTHAMLDIAQPEKMEPAEKLNVPEDSVSNEAPASTNTQTSAESGARLESIPAQLENSNSASGENSVSERTSAATAENPNRGPASCLTLGSADPESPYRMLVTLSTQGASVARVEMNESRLASMSDRPNFKGGYLGSLSLETDPNAAGGCLVDVVGEGTPAQKAGIQVGDRIVKLNETEIHNAQDLTEKVQDLLPGTKVSLTVKRGAEQTETILEAVLAREPVSVIAPEREPDETLSLEDAMSNTQVNRVNNFSFLTAFYAFGDKSLAKLDVEVKNQIQKDDFQFLDSFLDQEILGFDMHTATWKVESASQDSATFLYSMPIYGMEVRKTFTLARVEENQKKDEASPTYHLTLNVSVKNVGTHERKMAIQQDGPTGLLTEGYWFCSKAGRDWGTPGIRDVLIGYEGKNTPNVYTCSNIANGKWGRHIQCTQTPINYIGVDAQYFSSILIPDKANSSLPIERFVTLRVGNVPQKWITKTNTSCRVMSPAKTLKPGEEANQRFTIFIGPKRPKLLSQYDLDNVVYYGWFSWIARILVGILHFFYSIFGNYGIAILLLTALVRLLMFPLSKKQILSSIIMQKIQPEVKRINEKFTDPMERQKAQMELFKKYRYNPMSGCWVMLIQLPIFIALYRALLVDVELRQAPLFTETVRFCSNLVAPDMFLYWKNFVPEWIGSGYGFFGLGPYFNLLPLLTIIIFLVQQKIMMPPALDDQARMQQNMMKFMMLFMGFIFFKVPCGLCIYFIISSLWGLMERKFMPSADDYQLSTDGIIDMRVQNGKAVSNLNSPQKKEGFFTRLSKKMEEIQKAVEARDAEIERRKNQERKMKKR